jgi:hypothetical protein
MAAQIDFCPHGREAGSHGTANRPHRSNYRRTDWKMAARNELFPHGERDYPHRPVSRLHEAIFVRTERFEGCTTQSVFNPWLKNHRPQRIQSAYAALRRDKRAPPLPKPFAPWRWKTVIRR